MDEQRRPEGAKLLRRLGSGQGQHLAIGRQQAGETGARHQSGPFRQGDTLGAVSTHTATFIGPEETPFLVVLSMNQPHRIAPPPKIWPFEEAAKLVARMEATGKSVALFETGYGPLGLPHIGTFGEVARTSWVRQAFTALTGLPSRPHRLLGRYGWHAEGARQRPEPGDAAGVSRPGR